MELHGTAWLRQGLARGGVRWLVGSQLFLLALIWGYVAWRLTAGADARLVELVAANMPAQLRAEYALRGFEGAELRWLIGIIFRVAYVVLALVSLAYQGGLAVYYWRRRKALVEFCEEAERNSGLASE